MEDGQKSQRCCVDIENNVKFQMLDNTSVKKTKTMLHLKKRKSCRRTKQRHQREEGGGGIPACLAQGV
jgi:hypothetical protein